MSVVSLLSPVAVVNAATPSYTGTCTYEGDITINVPKGKSVLVYMTATGEDGTVEQIPLAGYSQNPNYKDELKKLKDNLDKVQAVFPEVNSVEDVTAEMLETYNDTVQSYDEELTFPIAAYATSSTEPVVMIGGEDEDDGIKLGIDASNYSAVNIYIADCDYDESTGESKATTDYQCLTLQIPLAKDVIPTITNVTVEEVSKGVYNITVTGNTGSHDSLFGGAYILDGDGNEVARYDIANTSAKASVFDAVTTDENGGFQCVLNSFTGGKTGYKVVVFNDLGSESEAYATPDMPNKPQDDAKTEEVKKSDLTLKVSKVKKSGDKRVATATTNKKAGIYVDDSYVGDCNGKKGVKLAFYYEGEYTITAIDKDGNSKSKTITVTFDDTGDDVAITPREDWNNDSEGGKLPQTGTMLLSTILGVCTLMGCVGLVLLKKKKGSE